MIINAFGDSVVAGFGVGRENSFVNIDRKDIIINNFGINGTTSLDVLNLINRVDFKDTFLLYVGINDFLSEISFYDVEKNIERIADSITGRCSKIVLCAPHFLSSDATYGWCNSSIFLSVNRKLELYQEFLVNLARCREFNIINYYKILGNYKDYDSLFFDGIHPTISTHKIMREELKKVVL
ncbi:SGNH/GDSL hydrolase family protein [Peptoniphilus mikwangii]|uniref:SGNH/GDSL hydrolase family protein n=1 Tax=Peptoniphilus mikwangii TaxID=1354300 RepID=UPI00041BFCB0|nr:GDSL-type esterase/lipase family protein [Peptoniphilus mikwangii]